jgi:hypothetical protein
MQRGTRVDDPPVPVVLTESRMLEKGRELAKIMGEVEQLQERKASANKKAQKEIDERLGQAARIAKEIRTQEEYRDQSTLKFDEEPANAKQDPTAVEAAAALAVVAHLVVPVEGREYFRERPEKCTKCEGVVEPINDARAQPGGALGPEHYEGLCGWLCANEECAVMHWLDTDVANERAKAAAEAANAAAAQAAAEGEAAAETPAAEGDDQADEEDLRARCLGLLPEGAGYAGEVCTRVLSATEIVKKLGLCEECQLAGNEAVSGTFKCESCEKVYALEQAQSTADDVKLCPGCMATGAEVAAAAADSDDVQDEDQDAGDDEPGINNPEQPEGVIDADEADDDEAEEEAGA